MIIMSESNIIQIENRLTQLVQSGKLPKPLFDEDIIRKSQHPNSQI